MFTTLGVPPLQSWHAVFPWEGIRFSSAHCPRHLCLVEPVPREHLVEMSRIKANVNLQVTYISALFLVICVYFRTQYSPSEEVSSFVNQGCQIHLFRPSSTRMPLIGMESTFNKYVMCQRTTCLQSHSTRGSRTKTVHINMTLFQDAFSQEDEVTNYIIDCFRNVLKIHASE